MTGFPFLLVQQLGYQHTAEKSLQQQAPGITNRQVSVDTADHVTCDPFGNSTEKRHRTQSTACHEDGNTYYDLSSWRLGFDQR